MPSAKPDTLNSVSMLLFILLVITIFPSKLNNLIVDEDLSAIQPARHAQLPPAVAGPDARDQAVIGAVGDPRGLFLVGKGDQHLHRAENFLPGQRVIGRHLGKQRRKDIVAAGGRVGVQPPLGRKRQFGLPPVDEALHDLLMPGRY